MSDKKGMPVWGWVLIGCGGITVVGLIAVVGLGLFAVKKGQEFIEDAERNPAYAAAKVIAATDPTIEIADSNDADQTVTLRNTETGQTVTLNLKEIQDGKISWTTDEGEVSIDASNAEDGMVVTSGDGQVTYGGIGGERPDWVLVYPGSESRNLTSSKSAEEVAGMISFTTDDTAEQVKTWYRKQLKDSGYEIQEASIGQTQNISGQKDGGKTRLAVIVGKDESTGKVAGSITYNKAL
ncbi:MAG: hypothetical protein QNK37_18970 [Acidobacteriota bacterium]|nr:hypothetical protein [Acidobacteriota bacterium]